ncbi:MAG: hypothetical protein FWF76_00060 [Oscillospiraceae bacterium]|nr:hypothetical protein [Oscillospiraceae bacterium]
MSDFFANSKAGFAVDILEVSSEHICDIITENYAAKIPFYIRKLSLDDYFSEKITGAFVIKTIQNA